MNSALSGRVDKRERRTKAAVADIRAEIFAVLRDDHPMTVRQVFYQLVVRDAIEKSEHEYKNTVVRLLGEMRLSGSVPWSWITDESRRTHQTQTYDSVKDALTETARFYRRSALRESDVYIEIWSEKEALSGIIWDEASEYDVPVVVSKGVPSLTQLFGSFANIHAAAQAGKYSYLYQFGDHDPSGCLIPEVIRLRLTEFSQKNDCPPPRVERIALTPEQIRRYRLPSRPTKRDGNSHAAKFAGRSTELDALPNQVLRRLVRGCIEQHISPHQVTILREAEELGTLSAQPPRQSCGRGWSGVMSDRRIPRHTFGPRAVEVGHFIAYADVPGDTVDFLEKINRRWPDLTFRDFWGAYVLALALAMQTEGRS